MIHKNNEFNNDNRGVCPAVQVVGTYMPVGGSILT